MNERPYILTVDITADGNASTTVDDGTIETNRKKTVYNINLEMMNRIIQMQYLAICDGNIREAEQTGKTLTNIVLPKEIRDALPDDGSTLLISTNEHGIPWELLWDNDFYGIKYAIGRQLLTTGNLKSVPVNNIKKDKKTCLILTNPTDDLPEAQNESTELMRFFRSRGISCTLISGSQITSADILVKLATGDFDIIHYSGHIDVDENGGYLKLLGEDRFYLKEALYLDDFGSPFIFLNGCGGGPKWGGSTNIITPLIYSGSGPILCATMPVTDRGSREFSQYVTEKLLSGISYGKAITESRKAFSTQGTTSVDWMCFVLYGNPNDVFIDVNNHISEIKKEEIVAIPAKEYGSYSESLKRVLGRAYGLTMDIYVISTSHLFSSLLAEKDDDIMSAFDALGLSSEVLNTIIATHFLIPADVEIRDVPNETAYSENAYSAVISAKQNAISEERQTQPRDVFEALLSSKNMITNILEENNIDCNELLRLL